MELKLNNNIKLSENVVLIDAAFLNFVISDLKNYFEQTLNRSLGEIDLSLFTTYLMLDAGITEGNNDIQFLFVYDSQSEQLAYCRPSDLKKDLNGVAFKSSYGEFSFVSVPSEGMVSRENLYLDLLTIVADSSDVKKIIVISFNEEYGDQVSEILDKVEKKDVFQFRMNEPEQNVTYKWDMLAFSIMQSLGIRSDEL